MKRNIFVVLLVQFLSISTFVVALALIINPMPVNDIKFVSEKVITSVER